MRGTRVVCLWLLAQPALGVAATPPPRNVILMVADGGGYNAWLATSLYEGTAGRGLLDGPEWVRLAVAVGSAGPAPGSAAALALGSGGRPSFDYDPQRAWDPRPASGVEGEFPYLFEGYRWLRQTAPDSASTATALVAGQRTYDGFLNVDRSGEPIVPTVPWLAKQSGKRVGTVTSVQWSHATPAAAGGAHAASRVAYCGIAYEMLTSPVLDVIAGCGHPSFDNNGHRVEDAGEHAYRHVGGRAVWNALTGQTGLAEGATACAAFPGEAVAIRAEETSELRRFQLVERKSAIEVLVAGPTPERLLVVPEVGETVLWGGVAVDPAALPRVGGTLQQGRGSRSNPRFTLPGDDPPIATVPSLATLTRVALNALDDDPDGLFLAIEGGAVDWAMHERQLGRMVEEMLDFKAAVRAVVEWIEQHGGWERNLLVITADHDHLLWGPRSNAIPFEALGDNGRGRLPSYRFLCDAHTNALVPLYARGAHAAELVARAIARDPVRGAYLEQTAIYEVLKQAVARADPR